MKSINILLAVSGGRDSMYLLHRMLNDGNFNVHVAHFNHKMRGEESDRDAEFVEKVCRELGLPFIAGEPDCVLRSEEDARNARYDFLERARIHFNCEYIATAHTADDNAETVLLNLARGTGLKGLCGIPEKRGRIVRPILNVTRSEIDRYISDNGIAFVEDSTNYSDKYSRNIIRHSIIPVLEQINPNFIESVTRTVTILKSDEDYLCREAGKCSLDRIGEYDRSIASRVIRANCPRSLTSSQIDDVLAFCRGTEYGELDLPGIKLIREKGIIKTEEPRPEYDIRFEHCQAGQVNSSLNTCYIKCDSIIGTLRSGIKQDGDSIKLAGRNCTKPLKKLFLEAGLTKAEKSTWPVIRDDQGVLFVYKLGVAERAAAAPGDDSIKIAITEIQNA